MAKSRIKGALNFIILTHIAQIQLVQFTNWSALIITVTITYLNTVRNLTAVKAPLQYKDDLATAKNWF